MSGKVYKKFPNCSDHYNGIDVIRNNWSELTVRSTLTFFNKKSGVNYNLRLTFTWTAP